VSCEVGEWVGYVQDGVWRVRVCMYFGVGCVKDDVCGVIEVCGCGMVRYVQDGVCG